MFRTVLAGLLLASAVPVMSPQAEASRRGFAVASRAVRGYSRDVRQLQRTTSRSLNQINRDFSRTIRQAPRVRTVAPRSSGIYLGSPRAGFYIRF